MQGALYIIKFTDMFGSPTGTGVSYALNSINVCKELMIPRLPI